MKFQGRIALVTGEAAVLAKQLRLNLPVKVRLLLSTIPEQLRKRKPFAIRFSAWGRKQYLFKPILPIEML